MLNNLATDSVGSAPVSLFLWRSIGARLAQNRCATSLSAPIGEGTGAKGAPLPLRCGAQAPAPRGGVPSPYRERQRTRRVVAKEKRKMSENDKLRELRRLLDPKLWPREYLLINGEVYWFVPSNDPEEERLTKPLRNGRFQ